MSSRFFTPILFRSLILAFIFFLGSNQVSHGSPFQDLDLDAFLMAKGFVKKQRQAIINLIPSEGDYTRKVKDQIEWFNQRGIQDPKKLTRTMQIVLSDPKINFEGVTSLFEKYKLKNIEIILSDHPYLLNLPIKEKLEPTLYELTENWKFGAADIEKSPELLRADLVRVKKLRVSLEKASSLSKEALFSSKLLSIEQRKDLIKSGSSKQIIQIVTAAGANNAKKNLSDLESFLVDKKFAYIERREIIDMGPLEDAHINRVKNQIEWFNQHGIQDTEKLTKVLKNILRHTNKYFEDRVTFLEKYKIKDVAKMISDYPSFLINTPQKNIEPAFSELMKNWKLEIGDIENSPRLLGADLARTKELRLFLDKIAKLANDAHFDFSKLSIAQREYLIKEGSIEKIFQMLKRARAISADKASLTKLTLEEQSAVEKLYRSGELIRPYKYDLNCQARFIRKKLQVK